MPIWLHISQFQCYTPICHPLNISDSKSYLLFIQIPGQQVTGLTTCAIRSGVYFGDMCANLCVDDLETGVPPVPLFLLVSPTSIQGDLSR